MRRKARIDGNHNQIVDALRQAGCSVQSLASIGRGVPDLIVARCGSMWLLEVKDGSRPPSNRRLTEDEAQWILNWKAPVHVVNSVEDALAVIQFT